MGSVNVEIAEAVRVSLADILQAKRRIAPHIVNTPLVASRSLSKRVGSDVYLKFEHRQHTGSFKFRGASNAVLSLGDDQKVKGIAAVSTGNHGRALALAAKQAGTRCVVAMSELVPQNKRDGISALGAEVVIHGRSQDEAQKAVDRMIADEGMATIPPFDHPDVIAGQGTLGVEIIEQLADIDTVLVQLSGGGLISGVAAAIKAVSPTTRIVGISMQRGAAMHASLAAGKPVEVEELPTLADSLGGGIGLNNAYTFAMTRALVDEVVLLDEEEIARGVHHAYWHEEEVVEGAGAVGIAALLAGKIAAPGRCVAILSGRNIDIAQHHKLISNQPVAR
ncbi:hydroxyectoine utilization dehydratase EutB [Cohaesibacter sp. CAU 1516]|uniref:hydroxyectoine utilization dehydratase EutB n=1 Tax=Cohaesibacter sp. CAU 1516 TaxID=2576038 RepID=UPI0010FD108D|nr:hydroxyectoine utilization dehydratase EutB [Cohaesibacter sp. CAU 1516]TLP43896.1 hydroxyectoine utilization dehydratase EutB [Cohaesibacter sp. CAU 1516]